MQTLFPLHNHLASVLLEKFRTASSLQNPSPQRTSLRSEVRRSREPLAFSPTNLTSSKNAPCFGNLISTYWFAILQDHLQLHLDVETSRPTRLLLVSTSQSSGLATDRLAKHLSQRQFKSSPEWNFSELLVRPTIPCSVATLVLQLLAGISRILLRSKLDNILPTCTYNSLSVQHRPSTCSFSAFTTQHCAGRLYFLRHITHYLRLFDSSRATVSVHIYPYIYKTILVLLNIIRYPKHPQLRQVRHNPNLLWNHILFFLHPHNKAT
ncbi:hypothetical protein VTL71DRAFT_14797 [Oculimacula yallundae]|uniref:Uncharacterized protein n=1 Tax=Oculimacula yallundae TaxID=86028 RepID=A0ABR4CJH0_9HELO